MKILVHTMSYAPEPTGTGKYTGEMCKWLAERGHSVEVITTLPYYPQWRVYEEYKGRLWHTELLDGVKVHRSPIYVPRKVTGRTRILHELSFGLSSLPYWLAAFFKKFDVVIGICPPLQMGILPRLYKAARGVLFVFHIQDLQVDAARSLGLINNELLLSALDHVEKHILEHASEVSTISDGMIDKVLSKGVPGERVFLFPNWVDTDFVCPLPRGNALRVELGFAPEEKVILYSGNMGEKQGLETVIDAARDMKDDARVVFAFVGEGVSRERIQSLATSHGLSNVRFFPLQPYERLPELLSLADVHLVIQKRSTSDLVMPSKLTGILAAGGLSIVTADSGTSLCDMIIDNKMGIVIEPENSEALAVALRDAVEEKGDLMRVNARRYAVEHLGLEAVLGRFEEMLLHICKGGHGGPDV